MIVNNERRAKPDFGNYINGPYFGLYVGLDKEYNIEDVIEIEKYVEETFIPGVDEIMYQIFNLYNVTLGMKSCVIRSDSRGSSFLVNNTFMEDYIYRFIELWNKIKEYIKIYHEFIVNICPSMFNYYRSWIGRIFIIRYCEIGNSICMHSRIKSYEFYCNIHVEEKFRYLKDIFQSD